MSTPVGPEPCSLMCPNCNQRVTSEVTYKATTRTHIIALILCLFVCWPCACCLYCTKCARNAEHHCPSCHAFLGAYER